MGKAKTKERTTKRRSVFLEAAEIIKKHDIDSSGIGFMKAADELLGLLDKAPHSGWLAEEWSICSALFASQDIPGSPSLDEYHEHCRGAKPFLAAYFLGLRNGLRKAEQRGAQS